MGGGLGITYADEKPPSLSEYAAAIKSQLKDMEIQLILEPGRVLVGNAGILVTEVLYRKSGEVKNFVIVDAGMNDLIRPPLYGAFHFIWPAAVQERFVPAKRQKELKIDGLEVADVVGPICEGADFFAQARAIPPVKRGDLISIFTAGAYGYTMSSNYNARPMAPEILVDGDKFTVIRKRQSYEDLVALEKPD
jgi:diaminopimelate decarboxylase